MGLHPLSECECHIMSIEAFLRKLVILTMLKDPRDHDLIFNYVLIWVHWYKSAIVRYKLCLRIIQTQTTCRHVLTGQIPPPPPSPPQHTPVSWTPTKWSIIPINLTIKSYGPDTDFWYECFVNLTLRLTLGEGHDTPLSHGQQLCEILSRSNMTVRSYGPDTYFGYVCTVTLTLEMWPRV